MVGRWSSLLKAGQQQRKLETQNLRMSCIMSTRVKIPPESEDMFVGLLAFVEGIRNMTVSSINLAGNG